MKGHKAYFLICDISNGKSYPFRKDWEGGREEGRRERERERPRGRERGRGGEKVIKEHDAAFESKSKATKD